MNDASRSARKKVVQAAIVAWMTLWTDGSVFGEPGPKTTLRHNLPEADSSRRGKYAGVEDVLSSRHSLVRLESVRSGVRFPETSVVLWAAPAGPVESATAADDVAGAAEALLGYVEAGGGLVLCTDGDAEGPSGSVAREILARLGIAQSRKRSSSKILRLAERTPLLGGLEWMLPGLTVLDAEEGLALRGRVLVPNDLSQKPEAREAADYAGFMAVWGEWGKGRIVIVGDTGWLRVPASVWARRGRGGSMEGNGRILEILVGWVGDRSAR